jgi:hypothetical protein
MLLGLVQLHHGSLCLSLVHKQQSVFQHCVRNEICVIPEFSRVGDDCLEALFGRGICVHVFQADSFEEAYKAEVVKVVIAQF